MGSTHDLELFGTGLSKLPFKIRYTKEYIKNPIQYSIRFRRSPNCDTWRPIFFSIGDDGVDMCDKYNSENIFHYYKDQSDYWSNSVCIEGGKDLTFKLKYIDGTYSKVFNRNISEYIYLEDKKVSQLIIGVIDDSKLDITEKIKFPKFNPRESDKDMIIINKVGCIIKDKDSNREEKFMVNGAGCIYPHNKNYIKNNILLYYRKEVENKIIILKDGVKTFETSFFPESCEIKFNKDIENINLGSCSHDYNDDYGVIDLSKLNNLKKLELYNIDAKKLILPSNLEKLSFSNFNCNNISFKGIDKLNKVVIYYSDIKVKSGKVHTLTYNRKKYGLLYIGGNYYFNGENVYKSKNHIGDILFRIGAKDLADELGVPFKKYGFYKKYNNKEQYVEFKDNSKVNGKYPVLNPWWERYFLYRNLYITNDHSIYHYYDYDADEIKYVEHDDITYCNNYYFDDEPHYLHLIDGLYKLYGDKLDKYIKDTDLVKFYDKWKDRMLIK
jgi:hypothetical protein